jgi:hypothetical protein
MWISKRKKRTKKKKKVVVVIVSTFFRTRHGNARCKKIYKYIEE